MKVNPHCIFIRLTMIDKPSHVHKQNRRICMGLFQ